MADIELIRKSPIIIVRNFIAVQFAASCLYFVAGALAYYAHIWRELPLANYVSFQIAQVAFLFAGETLLILWIFLMWWRHYIRITPTQLEDHQGLIMRRHVVVPRSRIASAVFTQNIFGRLTHYGTVTLRDAQGASLMRLDGIQEPEQFVKSVIGVYVEEVAPATGELESLLGVEEHEQLERKATFRSDLVSGKVNHVLERATMKTVAAFLNGHGGHVLLGVGDDHQPIGLEQDYATLARKDTDGFVNHFGNIFNTMLGGHFRHLVQLRPFTHQSKECMLIAVAPSFRPVYLNDGDKEEFFVRTGNSTTSLKLSEAAAYIESRWGTIS